MRAVCSKPDIHPECNKVINNKYPAGFSEVAVSHDIIFSLGYPVNSTTPKSWEPNSSHARMLAAAVAAASLISLAELKG